MSHAVKYTENGGTIRIALEEDTLVIADTGIGIASDELPRIFERGYTGSIGREQKHATGVGLYLCKKSLDLLGLKIQVESEVGVGTTVSIDVKIDDKIYE